MNRIPDKTILLWMPERGPCRSLDVTVAGKSRRAGEGVDQDNRGAASAPVVYFRQMLDGRERHNAAQKRFFERDPGRLATLVCRNPRFPRNLRKKLSLVASTLAGCRFVLEVGMGHTGRLRELLEALGEGSTYCGMDLALKPLTETRAALAEGGARRALLANATAEALPFADRTFDGVFCLDVLHHVATPQGMLAELRRVLQPGGRILCIEPNPLHPANLVYLGDPIERGLFRLTRRNASGWARSAGLVEMRLAELPIFFPGFPASWSAAYELAEAMLARLPGLRRLATTRVLTARRPA